MKRFDSMVRANATVEINFVLQNSASNPVILYRGLLTECDTFKIRLDKTVVVMEENFVDATACLIAVYQVLNIRYQKGVCNKMQFMQHACEVKTSLHKQVIKLLGGVSRET